MSALVRLRNQALVRVATRFPRMAQRFIDGYQLQQSSGEVPFVKAVTPLRQAKLALVTTSGIHHYP